MKRTKVTQYSFNKYIVKAERQTSVGKNRKPMLNFGNGQYYINDLLFQIKMTEAEVYEVQAKSLQ